MSNELLTKIQKEAIQKRNRIFAPILIGMTIILAVVALKPAYTAYIEKANALDTLATEQRSKTEDLIILKKLQSEFLSGGVTDLGKKIQKLDQKITTTELMRSVMINDYTRPNGLQTAPITVSNISVDKGNKLPNGLSLAQVQVSIQGASLTDIVNYITYLTQESNYSFILDELSLPIDTAPEDAALERGFGLGLTLGVYYYE